ncbi:uncharacterized protein LOC126998870 isoform X3 [Eriocheir sinensis]|uniref:uncharacterized protein LOC126998870 isoform X3 n=1 Tax=Eriocheir sinensis TaxID=95602 RepID=UPI0021C9C0EF|nr:uncharacterized protein LOC126998870 isoform X3 [Eriocheir sinensis]
MTSVVAGPRSSAQALSKMVSKTPRGGAGSGGGGGGKKLRNSADQQTHYHIHYHYQCEDHAPGEHEITFTDKQGGNPTHLPFFDIIPSTFSKKNDGKTRIQWSRHSSPQTGGSFRLNWAKHNVKETQRTPKPKNANAKGAGASARMAKTKTETTVRTYTKDGKKYEETMVVETREEDDGSVTTTTRTTTKTLDGGAFSTKGLASALEGARTSRGGRKSSSSSSDSSPTRVKPQRPKDKAETKPGKGGFLNKLKSAKSSDDSSDDEEDFAKSVHKSVNEYRVNHGVAKLKLSKEVFAIVMLNKYAKIWAKKLAADERMSHNPDPKYGENVFCLSSNSTNFNVDPKEVVDKWYSEIKDHKFGQEPKGTTLKSGHFSQLVWKDTKQMGVAKARSAAGTKVFVVANFDPQGNWMGQFADQVPPVGGFPKSATSGKTSIFNRARKSSSSSESSSDEEDFAEDCLKAHNTFRAKHGVQPLKMSKKLNKVAEEWAKNLAKRDMMQHRQNNEYGENLYCAYSSDPKFKVKGDVAVKSWYEEMKDFTFGKEPSDLRAGHFTQVVWADTKEMGVAYSKAKSGKIYVVANYSPAGNFVGSFAKKVPRAK